MLGQLVESESPSNLIFVEANPDLFGYILDYQRRRRIHIPEAAVIKASKWPAINAGLAKGFELKAEDVVQQEPDLSELGQLLAHDVSRVGTHLQRRNNTQELIEKKKAMLLASLMGKCALQKAGPSFSVKPLDVIRMGDVPVTSLKLVTDESRWSERKFLYTIHEGRGSTIGFQHTLAILAKTVQPAKLSACLEAWGRENHFKVQVKQNLQCDFKVLPNVLARDIRAAVEVEQDPSDDDAYSEDEVINDDDDKFEDESEKYDDDDEFDDDDDDGDLRI